jgi:predicted DNA-binding transcriptional regulator YafY
VAVWWPADRSRVAGGARVADDAGLSEKQSSGPERRPDSQQLIRQWALLRLLSEAPKSWGIKELSEQLCVSKATIERDIATLERDFAVVEEEAGKQKKTYRIDQKIRALETLTFGTTELLAIYAAQASLAGLAGTPIHEDLNSVLMKIRGFLSPRHNGGLNALSRVFVTHARGHVDYEPQRELIDHLVDAIARRRLCTLEYHAAWKGTTRKHQARPLRLVWHRSALYLLACLGTHERITTLAVQRIRELEVSAGEVFAAPRVDVDEHVAKAFGIFVSDEEQDVEIVFDAEIAWRLEERTFHPDERKERQPDGSLRYRVRSSAQWEILPWVQSFGALAELVQPASWRAVLRANIEATLGRYGAGTEPR